MTKRIFVGVLAVTVLILAVTSDHVWSQQDPVNLIRWLSGALLLAATASCWCLMQLARMARSADRTMDSFFWIVFIILPTSLGGVIWLGASIKMLAELVS